MPIQQAQHILCTERILCKLSVWLIKTASSTQAQVDFILILDANTPTFAIIVSFCTLWR